MVNYVLNLTPFASILFYIYMCGTKSVMGIRVRIHKAPEYGSGSEKNCETKIDPNVFLNRTTLFFTII